MIIDYKTSQKHVITDDINRQAAIYALLYQDRYGDHPEAVWIHFLIDPGDPIPIHIDEHLMDYGKTVGDIGAGKNPIHRGNRLSLHLWWVL